MFENHLGPRIRDAKSKCLVFEIIRLQCLPRISEDKTKEAVTNQSIHLIRASSGELVLEQDDSRDKHPLMHSFMV